MPFAAEVCNTTSWEFTNETDPEPDPLPEPEPEAKPLPDPLPELESEPKKYTAEASAVAAELIKLDEQFGDCTNFTWSPFDMLLRLITCAAPVTIRSGPNVNGVICSNVASSATKSPSVSPPVCQAE